MIRSLAPHSVSVRVIAARHENESVVEQIRELGYEVKTVSADEVWDHPACSAHRSIWVVRVEDAQGVEFVRALRRRFCEDGLLAIASQDFSLLAALLGAGADQAIPAYAGLLEACLLSLTRRLLNDWSPAEHVHIGRANSTIRIFGTLVQLRKTEFRICEYLIMNRGRWVTERELLQRVLDVEGDRETSVVRVHVNHIRKALGKLATCVVSERGRGYAFTLPGDVSSVRMHEEFEAAPLREVC